MEGKQIPFSILVQSCAYQEKQQGSGVAASFQHQTLQFQTHGQL